VTDGVEQKPGEERAPTSGIKIENEVPKIIRNISAVVGIVSVVAGLIFTVYELRMKSDADKETAEINREAERDKLTLGQAQIDAQNKQHMQDYQLEIEKRKLDIQQQENQMGASERRDERERLSSLITKLFDAPGTSEGSLASLFDYVKADPGSREIVQNAVLARLGRPRSLEEVYLGFRLLEEIGPSAIPAVIRANVAATRQLVLSLTIESERYSIDHKKNEVAKDRADFLAINTDLVVDVFIAAIENPNLSENEMNAEQLRNTPSQKPTIDMSAAVIAKSNSSLGALLRGRAQRDAQEVDLSGGYLTSRFVQSAIFKSTLSHMKCADCFIEVEEKDPLVSRYLDVRMPDAIIFKEADDGDAQVEYVRERSK
jgi:hypothetical protein